MAKLGRPKKYTGTESRVTVRLDEKRRKEVEAAAADRGTSMTDVVDVALTQFLNRRRGYAKQSSGARK